MTTGTNSIANIAIPATVAQGGTGNAAWAHSYSLIAGGTTSTGALQDTNVGTSGNIFVSGGASAPGAWNGAASVGCWQYIASASASSSASIAFTGLTTTYYAYKLLISALVPGTANASIYWLTSSNNGVSYDNSAANYAYANYYYGGTLTTLCSTSDTQIIIGSGLDTTTCTNLEITLIQGATSLASNGPTWMGHYIIHSGNSAVVFGTGSRLTTQVNNAFKILMSSGNIASGSFYLYGVLA